MTVGVWKTMALTAALLVWGADSPAQTTAGGLPAVRPAPVTGRVGTDPAAVALRPASQGPLTSTARQVPAPANLNEPLLPSEAAPLKISDSPRRMDRSAEARDAQPAPVQPDARRASRQQEPAPPMATRPHVDRTHGVKKANETQPRPHERKVKGKPHHAGQGASSVEPKDERRKGSKRGSQQAGHATGAAAPAVSTAHAVKAPASRAHGVKKGTAHRPVARLDDTNGHATRPTAASRQQPRTEARSGSKARREAHAQHPAKVMSHAHASAAKASAPVAKKPVRRVHPTV